jgi:hypothetical protein
MFVNVMFRDIAAGLEFCLSRVNVRFEAVEDCECGAEGDGFFEEREEVLVVEDTESCAQYCRFRVYQFLYWPEGG